MNIIIVGCGKVGRTLAEQLSNEKHNIVIVDIIEKKFKILPKTSILWDFSEMHQVSIPFSMPELKQQTF